MTRPLRKLNRYGVLYTRRSAVEAEIVELEKLTDDELVAKCCVLAKTSTDFVSSETLLYFVRNIESTPLRESILEVLIKRVILSLPGRNSSNSIVEMDIRDRVFGDLIDMILADKICYDERLDYYEVNFNQSIKYDRLDAERQVWGVENRTQELGTEDEEISPEVEEAIESYDPFDVYELDKENYRRRLDAAINALPPLQRCIVEMWRQEIPIISKDPNEMTISKALKKSDKTIRTHRDYAFATLRKRLEEKEKV
jgi:hypothetical protein